MTAKRLGLEPVRTLRALVEASGATVAETLRAVGEHVREGAWTLADVEAVLGPATTAAFGNASLEGPFLLRSRATHVLEETIRVQRFVQSGVSGVELGALMNASHDSLARLFNCSCPELDQVTAVCRSAPGALGSRLTGAGWGGWTVSLVEANQADAFCSSVWAYLRERPEFAGKRQQDCIVLSRPAEGANYFEGTA